jgi:hypothetical protein
MFLLSVKISVFQDQMIAITMKVDLAWKDTRLSFTNLSEGDNEVAYSNTWRSLSLLATCAALRDLF